MKCCLVAVLAMFVPMVMVGQDTRATISGAVLDSTGAGIPGVKVIATEKRTGTIVNSLSDSAGQYTIPFLSPGLYEVSGQAQGFKKFTRSGLEIGSGGGKKGRTNTRRSS